MIPHDGLPKKNEECPGDLNPRLTERNSHTYIIFNLISKTNISKTYDGYDD